MSHGARTPSGRAPSRIDRPARSSGQAARLHGDAAAGHADAPAGAAAGPADGQVRAPAGGGAPGLDPGHQAAGHRVEPQREQRAGGWQALPALHPTGCGDSASLPPRSRPRQWAGALQPDAAGRAAAATQGGPYCRFPFATPSQAWSLPGRCKELPEQAWRSRGRNVTKRGIVLLPLKHEKRGEGFCPAPVDQISVWIRYRRSNASPPLRRDG